MMLWRSCVFYNNRGAKFHVARIPFACQISENRASFRKTFWRCGTRDWHKFMCDDLWHERSGTDLAKYFWCFHNPASPFDEPVRSNGQARSNSFMCCRTFRNAVFRYRSQYEQKKGSISFLPTTTTSSFHQVSRYRISSKSKTIEWQILNSMITRSTNSN